MLTKIEVEDLQGHTASFPLQATDTGYTIKDIAGLDPVKSTIVSAQFAQLDGSQFQSSRRENRNIILTIGIEPYYGIWTVRDLRAALYAYFMPKNNVNLKFYMDDVLSASIMGQVESCEADLFSKDPQVVVSIICFDPNFVGPNEVTVNGNTVSGTTEQTINYPGSVETGYLFTLNVNRTAAGFTINNRRPDGSSAELDFTMALLNGDVISLSTVSRDKYVTITRGGVTSPALYAVSTTAKWGPLYPGDNFFRVSTAGAAIPYTVKYTPKYGGL
jgi:Phage tail protein